MIFYPLLLFSPAGNHRFLLNCSHNKLFIKYSVIVISKTTWGLHRVGINSFSSCIFKITLTTSFITVCLLQPGANLDLLLAQEIQGLSSTLEESCEYKNREVPWTKEFYLLQEEYGWWWGSYPGGAIHEVHSGLKVILDHRLYNIQISH